MVYFNGVTAKPTGTPTFDIEPRIIYPMEGGTMLITFEEEVVANKILDLKKHQVDLGSECSITVEARPVQLMVPRLVEIDSEVCPQRILVSNLPKMDAEALVNKLEIHFSKKRHGGGEVECCELMPDSWTVVLTFLEKDIAKGLTDKAYHKVELRNKQHRVKVTPFLNGNITNLETEMTVCPRTVLLSGIPDIMEKETLQDLLEIHFQKSNNGGGEILAILYNPLGQHASALFDGSSQKGDDE